MKIRTIRAAIAAFCCWLFAQSALADMPSTERRKAERIYVFGDTKIKQTFNSMRDPMSPEFRMMVYEKGRLQFQLNSVGFDHFFSSPDKHLFVGLSNSGWPGTAVIIFNKRGEVLLLARHDIANLDYCMQTSTFLKQWYDAKDPQVRFPLFEGHTGDKIPGITLKGCHGRRIDLLDTVKKANEGGYQRMREAMITMPTTPRQRTNS